jgi:DNA (cytosine-5)-methyltransferase 1
MIKFIDLFAGMGGIRLGFQEGLQKFDIDTECVMTSEIKPHAIKVLNNNFTHQIIVGDISNIKSKDIPDFDFLLAGFPCQPFSYGGKRLGFVDTRGTLFFEIERILAEKKPYGFILENVEGLVRHDKGRTLKIILEKLTAIGYQVSWKVLDSSNFGLAQSRKRIYIIGTLDKLIVLENFPVEKSVLENILERGLPTLESKFVTQLLKYYKIEDLYGKSIKDKRGGNYNIHSWDIRLKGEINKEQGVILDKLFKERRKKKWSAQIGIDYMDGIPLTLEQIETFHDSSNLEELLNDLVKKKYLKIEHPKKLIKENTELGIKTYRKEDYILPKGYNIVSGKLSYEINKILDPNGISPTLVATDMAKLGVVDNGGVRNITIREGLRLFGYPECYQLSNVSKREGFDLLGNTVAVNVIESITCRLADYL